MTDTRPLIIYHADEDGFGAAWAAATFMGREVDLFPAVYNAENLPDVRGREVYLLDICFDLEVMQDLEEKSSNFFVLDHHDKAMKIAKKMPDSSIYTSSTESACVMAWKWFNPLWKEGKADNPEVPWILTYIQDRDLWQWKLEHSKEINAYIGILPTELDVWTDLIKMSWEEVREAAKVARQATEAYIRSVLPQARILRVGGRRVPVINIPYWAVSDVLNVLAERKIHPGAQVGDMWRDVVLEEDDPVAEYAQNPPFALSWYKTANGGTKYSVRSSENCVTGYAYNVRTFSEKYGGGGHAKASGFYLKEGEKL